MSSSFAKTLAPPYYAVLFSAQRTAGDKGYSKMAGYMKELAKQQPGFLGIESAENINGFESPFLIGIQKNRSGRGKKM